jgi:hypothetical protein
MFKKILIVLLSIGIGLFGVLSTAGAFLLKDINPVVRIAGIVNGVILFIGAWLLFRWSMSAAGWLLVSAILYVVIALYDGFLTYGTSGLTRPFIAEFYWSLGMRLLFAVAAYVLLRGVTKEKRLTV